MINEHDEKTLKTLIDVLQPIIVRPPVERYSLAHPNDRALRFRTKISPTLPPSRRRKFPTQYAATGG